MSATVDPFDDLFSGYTTNTVPNTTTAAAAAAAHSLAANSASAQSGAQTVTASLSDSGGGGYRSSPPPSLTEGEGAASSPRIIVPVVSSAAGGLGSGVGVAVRSALSSSDYFDDDDAVVERIERREGKKGKNSDKEQMLKSDKKTKVATDTGRKTTVGNTTLPCITHEHTCHSFASASEMDSSHCHGHSHASCGHGHGHSHGDDDHYHDDDDHGHGHSHGGGGACGGGGRASSSASSAHWVDPWAASPNDLKTQRARKALALAIAFCACFMLIELVCGVVAHSIALVNDAVHMLTDVFNLGISLTAVILSTWAPTAMMTFGWRRAEVIGALASVFTTWMLVVWILVEAGQRIHSIIQCANGSAEDALCEAIDSRLMLGVGVVGFFANIGCLFILMWGGHHGHSHGVLGSGHGHGGGCSGGHDHSHGGAEESSHDDHGGNMNLRGAMLHVLGDCLQSLGVVVAAGLIWGGNQIEYSQPTVPRSYYNLADPFCSILFAVITTFTTFGLIKDVLVLLMEGCPQTLAATAGAPLRTLIEQLEGVKGIRSYHVWLLGTEHSMCVVNVLVDKRRMLALLEAKSDDCGGSALGVVEFQTKLISTIKRLATKSNVGFCSVEVTYLEE